jgi:protein tyrosine/serine phosphatase/predicted nucleotidyltransferase
MIQLKNIEKIKKLIPTIKGIEVALLYGSFGRGEGKPNSDVDIQLVVDSTFDIEMLSQALSNGFTNEISYITRIALRNKLVIYFNQSPKIEFAICTSIDEINRNYLGSEITNVSSTVLFANSKWNSKIISYLDDIQLQKKIDKENINLESMAIDLVDKFVYEFENCSTMHRRSDAFQFYFFYNIALHITIQLYCLKKGDLEYLFLPKNFVTDRLSTEEQNEFYQLNSSLFLSEANKKKRKLLEFFYSTIQNLIPEEKKNAVSDFLEFVFNRDYYWNFRDISKFNTRIKPGIIYRTGLLCSYQKDNSITPLLNSNNIQTIIDLRAQRETDEIPYRSDTISRINYINAPFDPWNQPDWFKEEHVYGTKDEIAYRFFALGCNTSIKIALEGILSAKEGAIAIHCHAGKDRTGILITLLHLLIDTPVEQIKADFLASEMDVKWYRMQMVLDIIQNKGGVENYILSCGLTQNQIDQLKLKLTHGQ